MSKAYICPGQASQFVGMGQDLHQNSARARALFERADQILGFSISQMMFTGTEQELMQTNVTQPSVFLHSVIKYGISDIGETPVAVAGHSLGEFSALVISGALSFEDGLVLVQKRASAMAKACREIKGAMAAIVGLDDQAVEEICAATSGVVVAANYNCPGQLVISGEQSAVDEAGAKLLEVGARRVMQLPVDGAFHSPLMAPAASELTAAVMSTRFSDPVCPIYQNVDGMASTDAEEIRNKLISQLTSPVRWTETIRNMWNDGIRHFVETGGTGKVLQSMVKRIEKEAITEAL